VEREDASRDYIKIAYRFRSKLVEILRINPVSMSGVKVVKLVIDQRILNVELQCEFDYTFRKTLTSITLTYQVSSYQTSYLGFPAGIMSIGSPVTIK